MAGRPHRHGRAEDPQEGRRARALQGHEGRDYHAQLRGGGQRQKQGQGKNDKKITGFVTLSVQGGPVELLRKL